MSKNVKKVIILVTAFFLAVLGVMAFYKTVVSPPKKMEFTQNRHLECVDAKINTIDARKVGYQNDSLYDAVTDMIKLCEDEGYISSSEKSSAMTTFMQKYIPLFNNWCYSRFRESVWKDDELKYMTDRINEISELPAASSFSSDLREISKILINFEKANKISTKFIDVKTAKTVISQADNYKQMEYLKNCTALVSKMNDVPKKIEANHYATLNKIKNNLWYYVEWDEGKFDDEYTRFSNKVKEYEDNKSIYRQYARSLETLKEDAKSIRREAKEYYEE